MASLVLSRKGKALTPLNREAAGLHTSSADFEQGGTLAAAERAAQFSKGRQALLTGRAEHFCRRRFLAAEQAYIRAKHLV